MHNGFLNVDNEKMSKSLGNFFTIRDVLKRYDGETLRFFMLRTHYRSPFNFSDAHLDDARSALRRLYTALDGVEASADRADRLAQPAGRRVPRRDGRRLQHARRRWPCCSTWPAKLNRTRSAADAPRCCRRSARRWACCSRRRAPTCRPAARIDDSRDRRAHRRTRAAAKQARDFARADRIRARAGRAGRRAQGLAAGHDLGQGLTWRSKPASGLVAGT